MSEFQEFPKMGRLSRECVVTEKIDGTNAQVLIEDAAYIADWSGAAATPWLKRVVTEHGEFGIAAGSRTRYITPHADNHGWAAWVLANAEELVKLGVGRHFGEWWGAGIQRRYGLAEKRFSLFNVARWHQVGAEPYVSVSADPRQPPKLSTEAPVCCHVVPVLARGVFSSLMIEAQIGRLAGDGSVAAPGFMNPEGVVVFHTANGAMFKKTLERDDEPKSKRAVV